jgi:hypothetical protein
MERPMLLWSILRQLTNLPPNLGEDFHYLQSRSDLNYWKGRALTMLGRQKEAEEAYAASANEAQDFKEMAVTSYRPSPIIVVSRASVGTRFGGLSTIFRSLPTRPTVAAITWKDRLLCDVAP